MRMGMGDEDDVSWRVDGGKQMVRGHLCPSGTTALGLGRLALIRGMCRMRRVA